MSNPRRYAKSVAARKANCSPKTKATVTEHGKRVEEKITLRNPAHNYPDDQYVKTANSSPVHEKTLVFLAASITQHYLISIE